jgi:hypothetical protein
MFRRNRPTYTATAEQLSRPVTPPPTPPREVVGITLDELAMLERVLLHVRDRKRTWAVSLGTHDTELIGELYRRAGAASAVNSDPGQARIPLYGDEFRELEGAIRDMERYRGDREIEREARQLLNRVNALLGQARAITHMGGTPIFDPETPPPPFPGVTSRA